MYINLYKGVYTGISSVILSFRKMVPYSLFAIPIKIPCIHLKKKRGELGIGLDIIGRVQMKNQSKQTAYPPPKGSNMLGLVTKCSYPRLLSSIMHKDSSREEQVHKWEILGGGTVRVLLSTL